VRLAAGAPARIGALLVQGQRLRAQGLHNCLGEQERTGARFGEVLVRQGQLSVAERDAVLAFQRVQRGVVPGDPGLRLGQILVATGDITREQLDAALERQKSEGGPLGEAVLATTSVPKRRLLAALRLQRKLVTAALRLALSVASVSPVAMLAACGAMGPAQESIVVPYLSSTHVAGATLHAWKLFCARQPHECERREGQATVPYSVTEQVNLQVNSRIRFVDDQTHFGVIDHWTTGQDGMGDCEDFALAKRQALRSLGYSSDSMKLVSLMTKTYAAESHMVLAVATERGDVILDNNYGTPQSPGNLGGLMITGVEFRGDWHPLERVAALARPTAAASVH
jgi:predicted transglutaminase-like cysteine proteinase